MCIGMGIALLSVYRGPDYYWGILAPGCYRLYGVKKMGAEHFRAHLVIDTEQVVRARIVVGDLPVVLVMEEMVRQVKACKLVVTGVCVDGESKEMVEWIWKLKP